VIVQFFKRYTDLIVGIIITTAFALTALAPESTFVLNTINIMFAPLFLGFLPGYALVSTMYPAKVDVTTSVRYVLAILWSFMLAPLIALILYFSPAELEIREWKLLIGSLAIYLFFIGIIQRMMTPLEERFQPTIWLNPEISIHKRIETKVSEYRLDRVQLWTLLSSAILICSILYAIFAFDRHDPYTEFYVSSVDISAYNASVVSTDQNAAAATTIATTTASNVTNNLAESSAANSDTVKPVYELWVVNQEIEETAYTIAQKTGVSEATYVSSFILAYKDKKQIRITLTAAQSSQDSITFLLFKDEDSVPYRTISFTP